ncbi:MAG: hypothetical protein ACJA08_003051 [Cyclobacteriaceae bacterium]|jgi:hypothetical protein
MSFRFRIHLPACIFFSFLGSCAGDFEVNLPPYDSKLVIDGAIEEGQFPVVYLTMSSGYYESVDSVSLLELIVPTARVSVSDGDEQEVLTLFRNTDRYPPFFYKGTDLRGEAGKTYTLEVVSRGETYTSITTIPEAIDLDSIWTQKVENSDSLYQVWLSFIDPSEQENFYRIFSKVEQYQSEFVPVYQSVVGDRFFDESDISFFILKGNDSFTDVKNDFYFRKGDFVAIKFCTLDSDHFDFWRTLERELYLTGNPFGSSGNNISSNVYGTAPVLGVWGGYGVSRHFIEVK